MQMLKQELWPKEGKLKKGIIILAIVVLSSLLITLLEEKIKFRHTQKLPVIIALACAGVWFYKPAKNENS